MVISVSSFFSVTIMDEFVFDPSKPQVKDQS